MLNNLDQLKTFYEIYAKRSVTAAANVLGVSQSAVSQSLRKLENELKTPLFTRVNKQLVPTAAGDRLFQTVQPFMVDLNRCLKTIGRGKEQPIGELRIGAPAEFGKRFLPKVAAGFRQQFPEVSFVIELGGQNRLLEMLRHGRIDFAFVDIFQNQSLYFGNLDVFHFDPVIEEEIILACSADYYEVNIQKDHSLEQLLEQQFVSYKPEGQSLKTWFKHHFGQTDPKIRPVLAIDSHEALVFAIQQHLGLGIIARRYVQEEIENGQIMPLKTDRPEIKNQINLAQLQEKVPTLAEKMFQKYVLEQLGLN